MTLENYSIQRQLHHPYWFYLAINLTPNLGSEPFTSCDKAVPFKKKKPQNENTLFLFFIFTYTEVFALKT